MQVGRIAAVAGASGYAGGELLRLLLGHPELARRAGRGRQRRRAAGHRAAPAAAAARRDHASPRPSRPSSPRPTWSSSRCRTASRPRWWPGSPRTCRWSTWAPTSGSPSAAAWSTYYGGAHAGSWPYGLPELPGARSALAGATRVANPGCYATTVALGLAPLLAAGLVEPADVVVVAASGTSGAGRSAKPHLLGSEVMGALSPYKAGGVHQHTPEMEQSLSAAAGTGVTLSFTPVLAPMPRGILATCTARLAAGTTEAELREALHAAYDDEPFVHVLPEGTWPTTAATLGSNSVHLQVAADRHSGRAVVVAALDNLVKGAAGPGGPERQPGARPGRDRRPARRTGSRHDASPRPTGFRAAGVAAGLKASGLLDVALVVNDGPARAAAGVFTGNRVKAAPVLWSQQVRARRPGRRGGPQLRRRQRLHRPGRVPGHPRAPPSGSAMALGVSAGDVAVCSTGLIGERLPIDRLLAGVDAAVAAARRRPAPTTRRGRS